MQQRLDTLPEADAGAWKSFEIARGAPETRLLIICDHATNLLPPEYGTLGLDGTQLNRHIGYDIGALAVALGIGQRLRTGAMLSRGIVPVIVSIHSFTEAWRGVLRKWHGAVLWDKDPRVAVPLLRELRTRTGFEIGDNEPYSGHLRNDSIFRHSTLGGLPSVLVEIRQDLIREAKGQHEWDALLADCLAAIFAGPENAAPLARVTHYGSHTDIRPQAQRQ
ncbi:MAG: N-formylglutamate amidohydrolase [Rhodomicrobium sp.]|nr:N-formylglutamate amidohydrolase [Rhodomicrobium sp.]